MNTLTLSTPSPLPLTHPFRKATELGCRWEKSTIQCSFHSRMPLNSISRPQYKVIAAGRGRAFSVLSPPSLTARGSEAAGGSGPHTPAIVSVWAGDPAEQGWRLGRPGPSWKPRGQVQGQASSAGSTPAGGFPETGHSSWERFPGPPGRTWPQALSAEGRGGGQGRDRPGPSLHMPSREPPLDRCTRTHVRTCVLVCARSLSVNHRDRPQT